MKMFNKKGGTCNADVGQVEIMKKAGWSTTAPKAEAPKVLTPAEAKAKATK